MRTLYHFSLSPFSRKVRLALAEKRLEFTLAALVPWTQREALLQLNPAGLVPVLVEADGLIVPDSAVVVEYLEEAYPAVPLLPQSPAGRVEARRLQAWFDQIFHAEVTVPLVYEKVHKRFAGQGMPDMPVIRLGMDALRVHLEALGDLAEQRRWLAGDEISIADLAAAAHLSCLDYLGDIPWQQFESAKEWYVRLKSRPCFRPLLGDLVPGLPPMRHYANLDF